jgi:hypothetical protein
MLEGDCAVIPAGKNVAARKRFEQRGRALAAPDLTASNELSFDFAYDKRGFIFSDRRRRGSCQRGSDGDEENGVGF